MKLKSVTKKLREIINNKLTTTNHLTITFKTKEGLVMSLYVERERKNDDFFSILWCKNSFMTTNNPIYEINNMIKVYEWSIINYELFNFRIIHKIYFGE